MKQTTVEVEETASSFKFETVYMHRE